MIKEIKSQLKEGHYASKSDLIRDALRQFLETPASFEESDFEKGIALSKTKLDYEGPGYIN